MRYLLDTQVLLWFFDDVEKLTASAFDAIVDPASEIFVSIASAWELAIKIRLGKLNFYGGVRNFFRTVEDNGFELLTIEAEYVNLVETLPLIHRDPFDRMLVSTAISEGMSIITADANIHQYSVDCVWL